VRSAWRPSQNRLSATRLGRSAARRSCRMGEPAGLSSDAPTAGPSASTQVSLLPPPRRIDTTETSRALDTRVRPPGIAAYESPEAPTYALSTSDRGSSRPPTQTGTLDGVT